MADEFDIISRYFAPLGETAPGALGLTDDAALISPDPDHEIVVTTDAIVEGVHFLADEDPSNVAARLTGSNLSDLAAMGAKPIGFTLACAWPDAATERDIQAFAAGLRSWVKDFDFPLLGGDTVRTTGPAVFSLTAIGDVPAGLALKRAGARPGDGVYVTGTIGDGALGLLAARSEVTGLNSAHTAFLLDRYQRPRPRIAAGLALRHTANACIDVSDGLVQDLGHIADVSNVAIEISAPDVPLSDAARAALSADGELLAVVLGGGDDYELAFCAPNAPTDLGVPATKIGFVSLGTPGVTVRDGTGAPVTLGASGYRHFE